MWSDKYDMEGNNPFPQFMVHSHAEAAQEAAGCFCCQDIPWTHVQLAVQYHPEAFPTELLPSPSVLSLFYCRDSALSRAVIDICTC